MVKMILPSTAPCCSSSDTFDVLQPAPSGQLRGGGSSKISPMSASLPGGTGVQYQLSSRATASAQLAMLCYLQISALLRDIGALGLACEFFVFFSRCRLPLQVQLPGEVCVLYRRTPYSLHSVRCCLLLFSFLKPPHEG